MHIKFTRLLISSILYSAASFSQQKVLDSNFHHLRFGNEPEWSGFSSDPKRQLQVDFSIGELKEHTLSFIQEDVKQEWELWLNGKKLGTIMDVESPMLAYWSLGSDKLRIGKNSLVIKQPDSVVDDIRIGKVVLLETSKANLLEQAHMEVTVIDSETKKHLPSRITITRADNVLQPVSVVSNDTLAVRPGCIYTSTGNASFGLPAGNYTVYASRGFEYGVDSFVVSIKQGENLKRQLVIKREVPTAGWISCDPHIHTFSFSRHGDATITERAITIAGEGIELPVMTDHNVYVDIDSTAKALNVRSYYTPVTGNEYTTRVGHFNVFPVDKASTPPDPDAKDWKAVANNLKNSSTNAAIILNHARDIHTKFQPFGAHHHLAVAGLTPGEATFPANAMEVMNSGSQQRDIMQLYHDWFGMLNGGQIITPVGASDSHDVMRFLIGQSRTYIKYKDNDVSNINVNDAVKQFMEGHVMVSFGLLAELTVNTSYGPGDIVRKSSGYNVTVRVLGPSWLQAERVALYANGERIREEKISGQGKNGVKWRGNFTIPASKRDLFLVAIAEGPGDAKPFWAIPKPYSPTSIDWNPRIIGSSGAIWIDADGDGKKTTAHDYAMKMIKGADGNYQQLFKELAHYDQSVAIQAASILTQSGISPNDEKLKALVQNASIQVKKGFELFEKAWNHYKTSSTKSK